MPTRRELLAGLSFSLLLGVVTWSLWATPSDTAAVSVLGVGVASQESFASRWAMAPVATETETTTPTVPPTETQTPPVPPTETHTPIPTEGEIYGFVRDANTLLGISGATVAAYLDGTVAGWDQTDAQGYYVISNLPHRAYRLTASAEGYEEHTRWVAVPAGASVRANFYLEPLVTDTPTPSPTLTASPSSSPTRTPTLTATPSRTPTSTATRTATASPTRTPTATATPTATFTAISPPTATPTGTPTPSFTPSPSRTATATRTASPSATASPTTTLTPSPTPTPSAWLYLPLIHKLQFGFCWPPPTAEPFWVDPVISPTSAFTQTVTVHLGRGRTVTVTSEAGTARINGFFGVSNPARVTINLLPNTVHHLKVIGRVEYAPGCFYGLSTTQDRYGHPLVIVQQRHTPTPSTIASLTVP